MFNFDGMDNQVFIAEVSKADNLKVYLNFKHYLLNVNMVGPKDRFYFKIDHLLTFEALMKKRGLNFTLLDRANV